jgi:hypothetical protein
VLAFRQHVFFFDAPSPPTFSCRIISVRRARRLRWLVSYGRVPERCVRRASSRRRRSRNRTDTSYYDLALISTSRNVHRRHRGSAHRVARPSSPSAAEQTDGCRKSSLGSPKFGDSSLQRTRRPLTQKYIVTTDAGLVNVSCSDRLAEQVTGAQGYGPNRRTAVKESCWNSKIINP